MGNLRKRIEQAEVLATPAQLGGPDSLRELLAMMRVEGDAESIGWLFPGARTEPDAEDERIAADVRAHPPALWQRLEKAYGGRDESHNTN